MFYPTGTKEKVMLPTGIIMTYSKRVDSCQQISKVKFQQRHSLHILGIRSSNIFYLTVINTLTTTMNNMQYRSST